MRFITFSSALAIGMLTLAAPAPCETQKTVVPPRALDKEDSKRVGDLYAKAVEFGQAGKFVEAQGPIQEIVALCIRVLGENHHRTDAYRREVEYLKRVAALPEAGRFEYQKTYKLWDESYELEKNGKIAEAARPLEQIQDIYRRLLGPDYYYTATAANRCGILLHDSDQFVEAEKQLREALRIIRIVEGEDSSNTASVYGNLGLCLAKQDKYAESLRHRETALAINQRIYGEGHPETAVALNNLAGHFEYFALSRDAETLYRKSEKALRSGGEEYQDKLATTCNNLALNLNHQGRYDDANDLFQEALAIRVMLQGEEHQDTGRVYMNLASNRDAQGDVADAEPLYRKALAAYQKGYGPNHSETAWSLNNLGVNLDNQGRYKDAEPYLRDALAIVTRLNNGYYVAKITNNLASCLQGQERYAEAEELCTKSLSMVRKLLPDDHPIVAVIVHNVAVNLAAQDRHADAEKHLREALEILKNRHTDNHPETATARDNLGVNLYQQGKFEEAERFFKEALDFQTRVLGEGHPSTARTYKHLVVNCCIRGDHAQAAALGTAATSSFEAARLRISFSGLGRASAAESSPLPALATVAARAGQSRDAWQALEQNLARGLLDDLVVRPLDAEERRREQDLLGRLDLLERRSAAVPAGKSADASGQTTADLRRERDAAQRQFVRFQAELSRRYGAAAGEVYKLPRIQEQLRDDAAFLAWLDMSDQDKRLDPKGDHWACLVRRRGDPVWVRLPGTGDNGAWTDEDDRLARRTGRAFARRPTDATSQWKELADQLARQRLTPLEEHLKAKDGLPAVRHLIVLPCPKMAAVPVEALTNQYTISYAPSGTMFAWLREQQARRAAPAPSLLALGDPAFQPPRDNGPLVKAGAPGAGASREAFVRLPGTRQEVMGVARVFSEVRFLMGDQANGPNLDELAASGGLRRYRYLHFATHGVLDDQRPMHSALILARSQPPIGNPLQNRDGRLTAEQILRGWKLDADLVTLSACETGLGKFSGGEGHLGFSQALFLAGARSLVLSLWQVDDAATALLMTRFYENLLGTPEETVKPMPKAEALAEAKRWLRTLGPEEVRELTKDLPTRGTRGRVEARTSAGDPKAIRSFEHPYYWSGFILIGNS